MKNIQKLWRGVLIPLTIFVGVFFCPIKASASWFGSPGVDYAPGAPNEYYCTSTGTVTTQAGVSASSPTISLYNPYGSGKNLVVLDVGVAVMASPAAAAQFFLAYNVGIATATGVNAGTGASGAMISANLVQKSTGTLTNAVAKCNVQGIIPTTPIAFRFIGGTTGAAAIGGVMLTDQTQGKVVVPPGAMISVQSSSVAALQAHILWREDGAL